MCTAECFRYRQHPNLLAVSCLLKYSRDGAMTRIGYAKPQMFRHPRGPYTTTKRPVSNVSHPSAGFRRLQGFPCRRIRWDHLMPPGVSSLTALKPSIRDHVKFHFNALPAPRVSHPHSRFLTTRRRAGLFHPASTPRVLVFRV